MDRSNLRDLQQQQQRRSAGPGKAKVMLFGDYSERRKGEVIEDPYYGGDEGFETAYEQCLRFSKAFLAEIVPNAGGSSTT